MKKINRYIYVAGLLTMSLTSLTGCIDETEPTSYATQNQVQQSSSAAEALLSAMPAYFNTIWSEDRHWSFGYGALMHIRDVQTGDLLKSSDSYNQFENWGQNKYQGDKYIYPQFIWNFYYGFINTANNMISGVNADNATDTQLGYLGAGYAFRAMLYLDLARSFEFLPNDKTSAINSYGHDVTGLTVPIIKAGMSQDSARSNPRVDHKTMAAFILGDLDNAEKYIVHLTNTNGKTLPNLACVYGLKARLYMWNEDYANAEKYARLAINESHLSPMTETQALNTKTGFNVVDPWMWGAQQTSENRTVTSGIINWTSFVSDESSFGYCGTGTGTYNEIDKNMYDRISNNDWRKLWFKAPKGTALDGKNLYVSDANGAIFPAYTSLKFRPGKGNSDDPNTGAATAYPIMRVEEMYFIEAEAAAHQDANKGKQLLEEFMKKYRNPSYTCKATSQADIIEEIVFQKRVELFGEGQTFFDIKRLNYSVTRGYAGTNWRDVQRFNTNGRPAWMNYCIVKTEGNNNKAVTEYNNPDPSDTYTPWTGK